METKEINGVMLVMSVAEYEADIEKRVQARLNEMPKYRNKTETEYHFKEGDFVRIDNEGIIYVVENIEFGTAKLSLANNFKNGTHSGQRIKCHVSRLKFLDAKLEAKKDLSRSLKPSVNYDIIRIRKHDSGCLYTIYMHILSNSFDLVHVQMIGNTVNINEEHCQLKGTLACNMIIETNSMDKKLDLHQTAEYCRKRIAEIIFESIALK